MTRDVLLSESRLPKLLERQQTLRNEWSDWRSLEFLLSRGSQVRVLPRLPATPTTYNQFTILTAASGVTDITWSDLMIARQVRYPGELAEIPFRILHLGPGSAAWGVPEAPTFRDSFRRGISQPCQHRADRLVQHGINAYIIT